MTQNCADGLHKSCALFAPVEESGCDCSCHKKTVEGAVETLRGLNDRMTGIVKKVGESSVEVVIGEGTTTLEMWKAKYEQIVQEFDEFKEEHEDCDDLHSDYDCDHSDCHSDDGSECDHGDCRPYDDSYSSEDYNDLENEKEELESNYDDMRERIETLRDALTEKRSDIADLLTQILDGEDIDTDNIESRFISAKTDDGVRVQYDTLTTELSMEEDVDGEWLTLGDHKYSD